MTKKHALVAIFLAPTFLLNAQNQQLNQDSLSFVNTKAEFVKYEQADGIDLYGYKIQNMGTGKVYQLSYPKMAQAIGDNSTTTKTGNTGRVELLWQVLDSAHMQVWY